MLAKIVSILLDTGKVLLGIAPIVNSIVPASRASTATAVESEIQALMNLGLAVETMNSAAGLNMTSEQKVSAMVPLASQIFLSSEALAGHSIDANQTAAWTAAMSQISAAILQAMTALKPENVQTANKVA